MNKKQAIEFVQSELNRPHFHLEDDCWYSCPLSTSDWHDGSGCCNDDLPRVCNCGKDQRDVKLRELLYYLQHGVKYNFDLANFVEYLGEE